MLLGKLQIIVGLSRVAALVEGEVVNLISDLLSRLSPLVRDSRWKTYVYLEYHS